MPIEPAGTAVRHLTAESFDRDIAGSIPTLVDFGAAWCPPCRAIAPTMEQLAREEAARLRVFKVDVDASPEIAARYGVAGLPTLILFKGGEPVERLVGYRTKPQLAAALAPHLDAAPVTPSPAAVSPA